MSQKSRVMFIEGKEATDCSLKNLAKAISIGQQLNGVYRYFLFGKPCDQEFFIKRISHEKAVIEHLRERHTFNIF